MAPVQITPVKISKAEARRLTLMAGVGLHKPRAPRSAGVAELVRRLGFVQIDTISVVERAHHHILGARLRDYQKPWLDQAGDQIFEYWAHAAAYLPWSHFRFTLPRKQRVRQNGHDWFAHEKQIVQNVLDRIRSEGPLRARDFESANHQGSWWDWKPAKRALEYLFQSGELMVLPRAGFQKVFELTERVLPRDIDTSEPDGKAMADYYIDFALNLWGIVSREEIAWKRQELTEGIDVTLAERVEEGSLIQAEIEGMPKISWWLRPETLREISSYRHAPGIQILSPFDPLVINRKRLSQLFNFDFTIECYIPSEKRKFGYFALPLLWGDSFCGLLDAKANRETGSLEIRHLRLDQRPKPGTTAYQKFEEAIAKALKGFAQFNGCPKIEGFPIPANKC